LLPLINRPGIHTTDLQAVVEQPLRQVAANEAATACNKNRFPMLLHYYGSVSLVPPVILSAAKDLRW
jgi:hypothetical protein